MGTVHQVLGFHSIPFTEIWLLDISIKKRKELLAHLAQAISTLHTVKKSTNTCIFTVKCKHLITGREIDKEDLDGLFHKEDLGKKHFEACLLEHLVKNKKPFFEPFFKTSLLTGNDKKKLFKTFISRKGGLPSFWFTC